MAQDWASQEFADIELGDQRLNGRVKRVAQMLYEKPESSINRACDTWTETKAAYRLFDNAKLSPEKIREAHRQKTIERMSAHEVVLAIQDTTFFNYDDHESKTGLGLIHSNKVPVQGILAHNTLITTTDGLPLGLLEQKIYARKNRVRPKNSPGYRPGPIENKESYRWIESIQMLKQHKPKDQRCIVVADREADIFELMQGCEERELEFIFRSTHNRVVGEKKKRWGPEQNANEYLLELVENQKAKARIEIEVEDHKTHKKRLARLELRFAQITLPAPWRLDHNIDGPSLKNKDRAEGSRAKVEAYVLEVREAHPPKGAQRIHWRLLTSMPILSIDAAKQVIGFYKMRWTIEIYHRVLKSGCKVEDCRLETFERLQRCITLYSVIAWRLFWMTKINQIDPQKECTEVFSPEEWQTLYRIANKTKKLPKKSPSARQTIRWMAMLGGFLGRTSDGEPGITTTWRGWQALNTFLNLKTYG